ncbi:hypothetical protein H6G89_17715 [Oscillatoria sp. FACHB-1407]|uniref:hypothetical protein n=1 Tax=Oscillatoria sp. FACHB-1407 TaxID=2692847 RepID=UPI001686272B|nr:hypothetical protein [Oscillatoria sp. FACHB-1407]MBD2462881.1 hypothetical protein [Oscillatoria sp. FACHB-1407]
MEFLEIKGYGNEGRSLLQVRKQSIKSSRYCVKHTTPIQASLHIYVALMGRYAPQRLAIAPWGELLRTAPFPIRLNLPLVRLQIQRDKSRHNRFILCQSLSATKSTRRDFGF